MFRKIYLIVASVSLATIVSCSSVRKTKTSSKETEKTTQTQTSNTNVKDVTTNTSVGTINSNSLKQGLQIDYEPKFDINGNLIPFAFASKAPNGTTTNVNISGSGKVKFFSEEQVDNIVNTLEEKFSKELDSVAEKKDVIDSTKTTDTSTKTKAPDYLKYIIGLIVIVVLLFGVVAFMYFYFKKKLLNITNLIP